MIRRQTLLPPAQNTRDAKIFVIATEGAETERRYFEAFNPEPALGVFTRSPIRVEVLPPLQGASAPQHVLALVAAKTRDLGLDPRDEVWLVLDVDNWPAHTLAKVVADAKRSGFPVAISNPCIEVWHCLHFATCSEAQILAACAQGRQGAQALKTLWKAQLPPSATRIERDHLKPRAPQALERARELDPGDISKARPWPEAPATRVYQVVEALLK